MLIPLSRLYVPALKVVFTPTVHPSVGVEPQSTADTVKEKIGTAMVKRSIIQNI